MSAVDLLAVGTEQDRRVPGGRRWWRRPAVIVPVVLLLTLALTGGALAAYFALAKVTGSGSAGTITATWQRDVANVSGSLTPEAASTAVVTSAGSVTSGGDLVLPVATFYPGQFLDLRAFVRASADGYVSGVALPGLPTGWTAAITEGCGTAIAKNNLQAITLRVARPDTVTATTGSFTIGTGGGVQVTPAATVPTGTTCAVYTAP